MNKATEEYKTESDLLGLFIDACCEMSPEYQIKQDTLFTSWHDWLTSEGEEDKEDMKKRTKRWFTTQLQARGVEYGGKGRQYYKGIRLSMGE